MTLTGKTIVITGGATGIGRAIGKLAAERGASVMLLGRTESKLREAVDDIGASAYYRVLDVTDGDAVAAAFRGIGAFDHLITAAAEIIAGPFTELPEADARRLFETKFWGQYRSVRAALPQLAADGSVVLFSGYLYRHAEAGFSGFAAVNGAVEGLAKALSIELAPVRVNAVSPGQIDVFADRMDAEAYREYRESVSAELPVGRPGTPEEAAEAALFLVENTFVNGITLDVHGGKH